MEKPRTQNPNDKPSGFPRGLGSLPHGDAELKLVKPANIREVIEASRRKSWPWARGSGVAFSQGQLDGFARNLGELADAMQSPFEQQKALIQSGKASVPSPAPSLTCSLNMSMIKRGSASAKEAPEAGEKRETMKSDGVLRRMSLFKVPEKGRRRSEGG